MLDANASVVPKEAFTDSGWRKVLLLIIVNVILGALAIGLLFVLKGDVTALAIIGVIVTFLIGLDSWYLNYNVKIYKGDAPPIDESVQKALDILKEK